MQFNARINTLRRLDNHVCQLTLGRDFEAVRLPMNRPPGRAAGRVGCGSRCRLLTVSW